MKKPNSLGRIMKYLGKHKLSLIAILLFSILSTAYTVLAPKVTGSIVTLLFEGVKNRSSFDSLIPEIVSLIATLLGIYVIASVFTLLQKFTMSKTAAKVMKSLREDIDKKMHVMKLNYYDTHTHGEILSTITNDVDRINETLGANLTETVSQGFKALGILVMMFATNWILALIALATVPISYFLSKKLLQLGTKKFDEQQELVGKLNGIIEENYAGQAVVQAFNYQERAKKDFDEINLQLQECSESAEKASSAVSPITMLVNSLGYVICSVVGCLLAIGGNMTVGNVQAMVQYAKEFSEPFTIISGLVGSFGAANAAAKRIFDLLDTEEEIPDPANPSMPKSNEGTVVFRNVSFGYVPDRLLMKDVNVSVKPGQKVAVVGPTGAGKTTLINLLMRFYEINGGSILVDGVDTRDMTREELRKRFGMVLQDTWLFEGSIMDNLGYGGTNIPKERLLEASKDACTDQFIKTLPGGYDMVLDKGAENISQGERQMLTIARAMATDPEIMILDEATSNVDTHTEVMIQEAMHKLMQGRTSFVIAHRLSTIRDSDMILYMEQGDIKEAGSHDELMALGGKYAALYNSQFA